MNAGARIGWVVVATLALQEVVLRALFPVPEVLGFDRSHYSRTVANTSSSQRRSLANARFRWVSEPDGVEFVHELNLYGFRDRDGSLTSPPAGPRVAILGDSMVEGFMAEADETLVARFAEQLRAAGGGGEALNFGVGASGIPEYLQLARDMVPLWRPDHLILVLYENDFVPSTFDPGWLVGAADFRRTGRGRPRLLHLVSELAAGRAVAKRWGGRPFAFVGAVPDPRNPWSDPSAAARMAGYVTPEIAAAMRSGRFNPHVVNRFHATRLRLLRPVELGPHLRALAEFLGRHSCELAVAYLPSLHQVSDAYLEPTAEFSKPPIHSLLGPEYQGHAQDLLRACEALEIPCVDLTPALRAAEGSDGRQYWEYDGHLRARGYATVGEAIFDWWQTYSP